LLGAHPLHCDEIVEVTLDCWSSIFRTKIGGRAQIGVHIFPRPQIMGFFLHELIPLEFSSRYPELWRREQSSDEKDLVFVPDNMLSVEIKTSSHKTQIFGNRSYAQQPNARKKQRYGYFLTVNFEKFEKNRQNPQILRIRFGWLDDEDWIGQHAQTGQQARLPGEIYGRKLLEIYPK
jgi:hypothetical protein